MRKVKLTQEDKEDKYIDKYQRKNTRAYTRLPMTTPESRDKLDSTLTPKLPNLLWKLKMREENFFWCVYK